MRSLIVAVLVCAGCFRHVGNDNCSDCVQVTGDAGDASSLDSPIDSSGRTTDAPSCGSGGMLLGNGIFKVCVPPSNWQPRTLTGDQSTDGNGSPLCDLMQSQADPPYVCVLIGSDITVSGTFRVHGASALAIVALGSITVGMGDEIDASSATGGAPGPGSPLACSPGAGGGSPDNSGAIGAGGGAGGAYGGNGGPGGSSPTGPMGGQPGGAFALAQVIGGCPGADGGTSGGSGGGVGGRGGGAVYLIARDTITVRGSINASGAGGEVAIQQSGGGGGGAGGLIALDAPVYNLTGSLYAIGGPGSSGGTASGAGNVGATATAPADTPTVAGSNGAGDGGAGRQTNGAQGGNATLTGSAAYGGAGGGGGGGGYLSIYTNGTTPPACGACAPPLMLMQ